MMNGIPPEIIQVLKADEIISQFIQDNEELEILFRTLTKEDIHLLMDEYPSLLKITHSNDPENEGRHEIACLSMISPNQSSDNYQKQKKIKVYIDISDAKVIKILQN